MALALGLDVAKFAIFVVYSSDKSTRRFLQRIYSSTIAMQQELQKLQDQITSLQKELTETKQQSSQTISLKSTLEHMNLIGMVVQADGCVSHYNAFAERILGWTKDEVVGRNFFDIFVPKAEQRSRHDAFDHALSHGGFFDQKERSYLTKSGAIRYIQMNTTVLGTPEQRETALAIIGEDVTDKRQTAEALGRSNAQLQDLVDNTTDLIQIISLEGRFLFVNKAWREILGYEYSDLAALRINDIIHPDFLEETEAKFKKIENGERIADFETVFRRKDGRRIYLSGSVNCRYENDNPVAFRCILHNSTLKVRAERAQNLYHSIAQATIKSDSLETLYESIHHELGQLIDVKNFFIAQYEHQTGYLFFPYYIDEFFDSRLHFTKRKLGNGLTEYAIAANKPLMFTDKDILELSERKEIYLYGEIPKVMLCVPLRIGTRVTGIIGVKSYERQNKYDFRDLELLEFISGQIAIAIERKQADENLAKQTARLKAIFESSSHVMWAVNKRLMLTSFNQNYGNLMSNALQQTPQLNFSTEKFGFRLVGIDNKKILEDRYREAFKGKKQYFEVALDSQIAENTWLEVYLNPIVLDNGTIEEVSGIARDITSKKVAELALQESEEKFRDIYESFQDIYCRINTAGKIVMVSPSIEGKIGYTEAETLNQPIGLFLGEAASPDKINLLISQGIATDFETTLKTRSGETRDYSLNMRVLYNQQNQAEFIEGVGRDITELKRSARELLKAKEDAERSLKVKENFLANMSHEIRTPMNGVIGMIDLLNETPLQTEQKEYVQIIKRSSQTLLNILNDILDLSKIEAGKMELHEAPVVFKDVFDKLIALFQQVASSRGNTIRYHLASDLPQYVIADETRLLQILSNLTSNALKFTENGQVSIEVSVKQKKGKFHRLLVNVKDTGIGISADNLKVLFNAFSQVDNSTKKSFGGTGLGLAISKELCRLMKGNIGVHSAWGKGSTFWFEIELKETLISPYQTQTQTTEFSINNHFSSHIPNVLLVDDNAVNRKVASEILKKAGAIVTTASSGRQAIELMDSVHKQTAFDIILMDIQMPDLDGIETTAAIKKLAIKLPPIVAMTAYSMKEDRERFINAGMDDYLPKPIRAQGLIEKVSHWTNTLAQPEAAPTPKSKHTSKETLIQTLSEKVNAFPMFDTPVVNQLAELAGAEMVASVFEDFENEATDQLKNCQLAYTQKDWKTLKAELHTLKGNAGTLGLARLHEAIKHIEHKAKVNDFTDFETEIPIAEAVYEQFLLEYKAFVSTLL
jgi:PAS domain S-box-containing protein